MRPDSVREKYVTNNGHDNVYRDSYSTNSMHFIDKSFFFIVATS